MLTVNNISKSFHHKKILKQVSFEVGRGEHVALLGPNGAGKTTLLKILAGIVRPLSGTAELLGEKLFTENSAHRRHLIFWGHAALFYPALTGYENIALFLALRAEKVSPESIREHLERYHLEGSKKDPVRTYSAGMLQRLTMIKLTLSSWQLGLIDEPTTGLDIEGLEFLKSLSEQWKRESKTLIFSTHDADWVRDRADRILLIDQGKVAFDTREVKTADIQAVMQGKF
ncbi:MAG: ABC transporter ATP-binding protein [FCB group bacterium]|nr:ABC transporter ATP-binding protein [FCB group bacterium]